MLAACSDDGSKRTPDVGPDVGSMTDVFPDVTPDDTDVVDQGVSATCVASTGSFPRPLNLPNPEPNGVFDPSLALDPETQRLWMAYSGVTGPAGSGAVSTHLAYSDDQGGTWCDVGVVNASTTEPNPPDAFAGLEAKWNHETPSIAYDPGAAPQARWRLVWMRYLHIEDNNPATEDRHFEHGWIGQRTAAKPEDLISSPPTKLFGASSYYSPGVAAYNDLTDGTPELRWDSHPQLGDCLVFAEPGLLALDSKLWMAVYCARTAIDGSIELIELDHATDVWSHRSTLLTGADGGVINPAITGFNAPDLFMVGDTVHLLVSPVVELYAGCVGYRVDRTLAVVLDADGNGADPVSGLAAPAGTVQSGACTYHEGSSLGVIYGDTLASGVQFQLFSTGAMF